jgi:hypothetical protein
MLWKFRIWLAVYRLVWILPLLAVLVSIIFIQPTASAPIFGLVVVAGVVLIVASYDVGGGAYYPDQEDLARQELFDDVVRHRRSERWWLL